MKPFTKLVSKGAPLRADNVDTDQIIPARYLTTVSKEGLGEGLFDAWRYREGAPNPDFVLNRAPYAGSEILISGDNFGCGSSREHAVWALTDYGFRAVIAAGFADIFHSNSLKNGLLPIALNKPTIEHLLHLVETDPQTVLTIDLEAQTVAVAGQSYGFEIAPFRKECLLKGLDDMGYLLQRLPKIAAFEADYATHSSQPSKLGEHHVLQ